MMRATDVVATITRPADRFGTDWNWAEAATAAWLHAARDAGVTIEDYDDHGDSVAARVRVDGTWYDLEIGRSGGRAPDDVRAVEVE